MRWIISICFGLFCACSSLNTRSRLDQLPVCDQTASTHQFTDGVYGYTLRINPDSIDSSVKAAQSLSDRINEDHISGSIWFIDNCRFLHVSHYNRLYDTEPFPFIKLYGKFGQGVYHVGNYQVNGDEIILEFRGTNRSDKSRDFTIVAKFNNDRILFEEFRADKIEKLEIPDKIELNDVFATSIYYDFYPMDTKLALTKFEIVERVEIDQANGTYHYITSKQEKFSRQIRKFRQLKKNN